MKFRSGLALQAYWFMIVLATACAGILMVARVSVGERAELSLETANAVFELCHMPGFTDAKSAVSTFNAAFSRIKSGQTSWWQSHKDPYLLACQTVGAGMWSQIRLVFIYNRQAKRIMGMRVIEQNETAGLGDRIADEQFVDQFVDMDASGPIEMAVARSSARQFDAVSGATVTSKAIERIINKALKIHEQLDQQISAAAGAL